MEEVVVGVDDDDCCVGRHGQVRLSRIEVLLSLPKYRMGGMESLYSFASIVPSIKTLIAT